MCRVLANYIVWNAINAQVGYFPSKFIEASFLLSKVESGIASVDPRWQRCVSKVNSAFGYASSALYVLDHFAKESRSKVDICWYFIMIYIELYVVKFAAIYLKEIWICHLFWICIYFQVYMDKWFLSQFVFLFTIQIYWATI